MRIDWYAVWPFLIRYDLDLRSKVKLWLIWRASTSRSRCWQDACRSCRAIPESSYYRNIRFSKNRYFSFCSLDTKPMIFGQIWELTTDRALKNLSNVLFRIGIIWPLIIISLCGPGAEFVGVSASPGPARFAPSTSPASVKTEICPYIPLKVIQHCFVAVFYCYNIIMWMHFSQLLIQFHYFHEELRITLSL